MQPSAEDGRGAGVFRHDHAAFQFHAGDEEREDARARTAWACRISRGRGGKRENGNAGTAAHGRPGEAHRIPVREVVNSVHCTPYRAGFRENGGACRNPCRKRAETRGCGHAVPCRSGGGPHRAAFLIRGDARYKLFPPAVRNGNCQVVRSRFSGLGEAYGRVPAGGPGTVSNIGPSGHRGVS